MSMKVWCLSVLTALLVVSAPSAALDVVSTTSVLWDPAQSIGGEYVDVIYIADPAVCPHMQGDVIPNRIQIEKEFIRSADLFIAHNGSVDKQYVMPYVDDFMEANEYGTVTWVTLKDPAMTWNTPEKAALLAEEVRDWLIAADPDHSAYYTQKCEAYINEINAAGQLTAEEQATIPDQQVVPMVWQQDAAENWLGLDVVDIYAPDFYQKGEYTAVKLVDRINQNPDAYADVVYVIENMQSGELGKGVEEALSDKGYTVKRVIFTNFPKSVDGVDSIPDVLAYNKGLVTPTADGSADGQPEPTSSPGFGMLAGILGIGLVLCGRKGVA